MIRLRAPFHRFLRDQRGGTSTIEFVIVFPLIFLVFYSTFEAAMLTLRTTMLERALDLTVRELRLSTAKQVSPTDIVKSVCSRAYAIPDCTSALILELHRINTNTFALPSTQTGCVNKGTGFTPVQHWTPGAGNELMLVRACAKVPTWFPLTGLGLALTKDSNGDYEIQAVAGLVNEP